MSALVRRWSSARCSSSTAARSRSSSATRSWPCSASRVVHEDDALRAVRAAAELQALLEQLNDELERTLGIQLDVRIGINTGEVVARRPTRGRRSSPATPSTRPSGSRRPPAPGEILLGDGHGRLVARRGHRRAGRAARREGQARAGRGLARARRRSGRAGVRAATRRAARRPRRRARGACGPRSSAPAATRAAASSPSSAPPGSASRGSRRELVAGRRRRGHRPRRPLPPVRRGITFWPLGEILRAAGGPRRSLRCSSTASPTRPPSRERLEVAIGDSSAAASPRTRSSGPCAAARGARARRGRSSSASRTSTGPSRRSSTCVEYLVGSSRTRRSCCSCLARPELLEHARWRRRAPSRSTLEPLSRRRVRASCWTTSASSERRRSAAGSPRPPRGTRSSSSSSPRW